MRVAHVIVGLGLGGAERMLLNLVRHEQATVENLVISMTGTDDLRTAIERTGAGVVVLGMRRGVPDPRGLRRARRALRDFHPDVVQTWMYHADLVGGLAARSLQLPVVWNVQSTTLSDEGGKRATAWVRSACARLSRSVPNRIVACAESAARVHVALGYDGSRMVVIPNGVDVAGFGRDRQAGEQVRDELGLGPDALVIGNVARWHPYKDHATLIGAFGLLAERHPEARLMLVGSDMDRANRELMHLLEHARVTERTILLGPRHDVARLLDALDLFVLSSSEEALPNALLEAMASAVPVIATDVGDCRKVVGDAGLVVPPGRPDLLGDALREMLERPADERVDIGTRARRRVTDGYSIDVVAARYVELWREVAQS